eukprot:Phypoly_transcript_09607.p2 GENE.Phypoly_transcript_09607~~Phypoly_transcript_09607.p2  ORF type:complete len:128 (-),score=36.88 Phypoly_transcript_09607:247-630(-)
MVGVTTLDPTLSGGRSHRLTPTYYPTRRAWGLTDLSAPTATFPSSSSSSSSFSSLASTSSPSPSSPPSFSSQLLDVPSPSPQQSLSSAAQAVAEAINKLLSSMGDLDEDKPKRSRICYTSSMEVINR